MDDIEHLSDDQYSRLNACYHRVDAAKEQLEYVTQQIWRERKMRTGDAVLPDGRVLRIGRDDDLLAQNEEAPPR